MKNWSREKVEAGINPTLIILAGGKSTRMGEDKALMFDNTSRIQKIAENLEEVIPLELWLNLLK